MKKKPFKIKLILFVLLACAVWFVAKFAGHAFLRLYVEAGIGSCRKIPILCAVPSETIINPGIDDKFVDSLIPYKSPKMDIALPKEFSVTQEAIKKVYYKRKKRSSGEKAVYLLYKPPDFFVGLYPRLKKQGVGDDYEFIRRIMHANLSQINNVTDAFFVIMKGIFTPDLGNQKNVKMVEFQFADKRGFINYSLSNTAFDCNVISEKGSFFKVYIKDEEASLDLVKVLAIINTLTNVD
ncbi:MAG: hypothetical protein V1923_00215 [Candidatus Omnitrophota bacterium]